MRKLSCLAAALLLGGCGLFGGKQGPTGSSFAPQYDGLANKSLGIVIYVQPATVNEYPGTAEEISNFVVAQLQEHSGKTRLLSPRDVMNWQHDTINWYALPEKDIGRHFGVDRVLFIEVLDYSTRKTVGYGNMQGRLRAQCRIFETDDPARNNGKDTVAWTGLIDAAWPPYGPLDPTQTNERAVRMRTLESFADQLVRHFYDHG